MMASRQYSELTKVVYVLLQLAHGHISESISDSEMCQSETADLAPVLQLLALHMTTV